MAVCAAGIAAAQPTTSPGAAAPAGATQSFLLGPPKQAGPVVVQAAFQLRHINEIDDEAETFEFTGVLMLRWRDARQAFDPAQAGVDEKVYQGAYQVEEVFTGWSPQVVLINESGLYEKRGVLLRVRPDGTVILVEQLNAIATVDLDMRRYPLDSQRLEAVFEVMGFDRNEVELQARKVRGPQKVIRIPQWNVTGITFSTRDRPTVQERINSVFVMTVEAKRQSFFVSRLIVFPLVLIVLLSFSVFWMDRSSLGDRIGVSFIGILTAVAYQVVMSEILPRISYVTLMNGFLNLSFLTMCGTVVINLVVGALDRSGKSEAGDRIDRRCRWLFPLVYFTLMGLALAVALLFF